MSFKKECYTVIKKAVSKELCNFLYNYFSLKKYVYDTCLRHRYFSPYEQIMGYYESPKQQVPNTYTNYGDVALETLLLKIQPLIEKETKLKLLPNYTYVRNYKNGDILKAHKDRFSCEISTTLNLGGDPWPIYLKDLNSKKKKINLNPGDMLLYKGMVLEHWRESFTGTDCVQAFLHYNDAKKLKAEDNIYDKRPHLGLPTWFKGKV